MTHALILGAMFSPAAHVVDDIAGEWRVESFTVGDTPIGNGKETEKGTGVFCAFASALVTGFSESD